MLSILETEILQDSILALEDLIRKYKGEEQITKFKAKSIIKNTCGSCPLCQLNKLYQNYTDTTCICPWVWITGNECASKYNYYAVIPKHLRLMQIRHWIVLIKKELNMRRT